MRVAWAGMSWEQREVCDLLLEGLSNREIAKRSGRSEVAIKKALEKLVTGFNIKGGLSRIRLMLYLHQMGLCKSCNGENTCQTMSDSGFTDYSPHSLGAGPAPSQADSPTS